MSNPLDFLISAPRGESPIFKWGTSKPGGLVLDGDSDPLPSGVPVWLISEPGDGARVFVVIVNRQVVVLGRPY